MAEVAAVMRFWGVGEMAAVMRSSEVATDDSEAEAQSQARGFPTVAVGGIGGDAGGDPIEKIPGIRGRWCWGWADDLTRAFTPVEVFPPLHIVRRRVRRGWRPRRQREVRVGRKLWWRRRQAGELCARSASQMRRTEAVRERPAHVEDVSHPPTELAPNNAHSGLVVRVPPTSISP